MTGATRGSGSKAAAAAARSSPTGVVPRASRRRPGTRSANSLARSANTDGSNISTSVPASVSTYAWSSTEPMGCNAVDRQPDTMLAPMA